MDDHAVKPRRFSGPHVVYRCFDAAGHLLYIGCTASPATRFRKHAKQSRWWAEVASITRETHDGRTAGLHAETLAIALEHPRYNVRDQSPAAPTLLPAGRQLFEQHRPKYTRNLRCAICGRTGMPGGRWKDACRIRHGHLAELA